MDLHALELALAEAGVPAERVVLGGSAEMCNCVARAEDGAWEVFFVERGTQFDVARFPTESAACDELLARLTGKRSW